MQAELNALAAKNTWSASALPPGAQAIRCKWVYKIKLKADGSIERYKASDAAWACRSRICNTQLLQFFHET